MALVSKKLHHKIYFYLLIVVVITLPYGRYPAFNGIAIILLLLNWLLEMNFRAKFQKIAQQKGVIVLITYFLWHVFTLTYSQNLDSGLKSVERRLAILILPLVIASSITINKKQLDILLRFFTYNLFFIAFLSFLIAFYKNYQTNHFEGFLIEFYTYHQLTKWIELDPIYLSTFFCLVVIYFILEFWENRLNDNVKSKTISFIAIFGGIFMVFILSSRMQILALCFIIFLMTLYFFYEAKQMIKGLILLFFLALIFSILIFLNPTNRERFSDIISPKEHIILDGKEDHSLERHWGGRALREAQWTCAWDLIHENSITRFTGFGIGDAQDELQRSYEEHKFYFASRYNRYNAHNQYLQDWIGLGVLGLVFLLFFLFYPLYQSFKKGNYLFIGFLLVIILSLITECMFCRQLGIVFISFFYPLLYQKQSTIDYRAI